MEFSVQLPKALPGQLEGPNGKFPGNGGEKPDPARQAAEEFEAVFLAQMMAPLFDGLDGDGLFGGGSSEQVYRSFMVQEYGKAMAKNGGVGIADQVYREILKLQEVAQ
ncbi:MAG: rod-binding protein [Pseudomonadota bacterium]